MSCGLVVKGGYHAVPRFSSFSLPLVAVAACTDSQRGTTLTEPLGPSYAAGKGPPDTSGPHVIRDPAAPNVLSLGGDPANPLAVVAGLEGPVADFCSAAGAAISSHVVQLVFPPSGRLQFKVSGHEVAIQVFDYGAGIVTDTCQLVGAPVVATGTGTVRLGIHSAAVGPGGTSIHATVRGIVDLTSGGQARLLATAQVVVRPNGSLVIDKERVTLTPL
jgi:hypothetical protein